MTPQQLASYFDHTLLKAYATEKELTALCDEARTYGFKMVAINSSPVRFCKEQLKDTPVHIGAAISFPLGQTTVAVKLFEAETALSEGADEIDYVINVGMARMHRWDYIEDEMRRMTELCRRRGVIVKAIFENCYLERDEIAELARIAARVRPDFIKTSTGFGTGGATVEDVRLMKQSCGPDVQVKAAGGIRTLSDCLAMIEAGATRIGTSSGVKLVEELKRMGKLNNGDLETGTSVQGIHLGR